MSTLASVEDLFWPPTLLSYCRQKIVLVLTEASIPIQHHSFWLPHLLLLLH